MRLRTWCLPDVCSVNKHLEHTYHAPCPVPGATGVLLGHLDPKATGGLGQAWAPASPNQQLAVGRLVGGGFLLLFLELESGPGLSKGWLLGEQRVAGVFHLGSCCLYLPWLCPASKSFAVSLGLALHFSSRSCAGGAHLVLACSVRAHRPNYLTH